MFDLFICYRGSSSAGKFVGDKIYTTLFGKVNYQIYFSPKVENVNFINDINYLETNIKRMIVILTRDFFLDFLNDDLSLNESSITMREIVAASKNDNLTYTLVTFSDFNWNDQNYFGLSNKEILVKAVGEECANRIIGTPSTPYLPLYEDAFLKLIYDTFKAKEIRLKTKAVFFDFDGTITKPKYATNTWLRVWQSLNYDDSLCIGFHQQYTDKEISHKKWCEITTSYFKKGHLTKSKVESLAKGVKLLDDVYETLIALKRKGIKLYIVSGSIDTYLETVLTPRIYSLFDEIRVNRFVYDSKGNFEYIVGTEYDFEGKAVFVRSKIAELGILPQNVLYVGNSFNDEFVYSVGCTTLCVNPKETSIYNKRVWNHSIIKCHSLLDIVKYIKFED